MAEPSDLPPEALVEPCPSENWVEVDFDSSIPSHMPVATRLAGLDADLAPAEAGEGFHVVDAASGAVVAEGRLDADGFARVCLPPATQVVNFFLGPAERLSEPAPPDTDEARHWAVDVPLQVVGGVRDAAQEIIDIANASGIWIEKNVLAVGYLEIATGSDAANGWLDFDYVLPGDADYDPDSMAIPSLPEVAAGKSGAGRATRGVAQFLTGFVPAMRAVRFIRPVTATGQAVKFAAVGAVVDATVFDPHEARLSDLVQQYPALANPVTEYLASDPADSAAEGRFKNALEGVVAGELVGQFFRAVRLIKLSRMRFKFTGRARERVVLASETLTEVVEVLVAAARRVEPATTATLARISAQLGGQMRGLDYRLKTRDSLARKIEADAAASGDLYSEVAESMNDVLRYTVTFDDAAYTDSVRAMIDALAASGYASFKLKNFWGNAAGYRGINAVFVTPQGFRFELQFHTARSFDVKQNLAHELYEQMRVLPAAAPERAALEAQMDALFETIARPAGAEAIR